MAVPFLQENLEEPLEFLEQVGALGALSDMRMGSTG